MPDNSHQEHECEEQGWWEDWLDPPYRQQWLDSTIWYTGVRPWKGTCHCHMNSQDREHKEDHVCYLAGRHHQSTPLLNHSSQKQFCRIHGSTAMLTYLILLLLFWPCKWETTIIFLNRDLTSDPTNRLDLCNPHIIIMHFNGKLCHTHPILNTTTILLFMQTKIALLPFKSAANQKDHEDSWSWILLCWSLYTDQLAEWKQRSHSTACTNQNTKFTGLWKDPISSFSSYTALDRRKT